MSALIAGDVSLLERELDRTIELLLPMVEDLIQRLAPDQIVTSEVDEWGYVTSAPVRFTDGVGSGRAVAQLFRYRDMVRIDVELDHNRKLAHADGSPSERRCFLNDYVASVMLAPGSERLPDDFRRTVLRGMKGALDAVRRHNRKHSEPWHQIRVTAG
ncbi:MAG: hypothetical protein ACE5PT_12140 [Gemmatimonadales bacterium]